MNPYRKGDIVTIGDVNGEDTMQGVVVSAPQLSLHCAVEVQGRKTPIIFDSVDNVEVKREGGRYFIIDKTGEL